MIFEKSRKTDTHIFFYNNIELEVVDDFKYLETMFYRNGIRNRTPKWVFQGERGGGGEEEEEGGGGLILSAYIHSFAESY